MSLKDRKELSALEDKIKAHMAGNQVFRSEYLDWIAAQKELLVKELVAENDDSTRGKIQMLDYMNEMVQITT
jgi:hypothetical protein